jgi:hypothetical protein
MRLDEGVLRNVRTQWDQKSASVPMQAEVLGE